MFFLRAIHREKLRLGDMDLFCVHHEILCRGALIDGAVDGECAEFLEALDAFEAAGEDAAIGIYDLDGGNALALCFLGVAAYVPWGGACVRALFVAGGEFFAISEQEGGAAIYEDFFTPHDEALEDDFIAGLRGGAGDVDGLGIRDGLVGEKRIERGGGWGVCDRGFLFPAGSQGDGSDGEQEFNFHGFRI